MMMYKQNITVLFHVVNISSTGWYSVW